jgi:hypothetical protein
VLILLRQGVYVLPETGFAHAANLEGGIMLEIWFFSPERRS